jgi:hypothetical protein
MATNMAPVRSSAAYGSASQANHGWHWQAKGIATGPARLAWLAARVLGCMRSPQGQALLLCTLSSILAGAISVCCGGRAAVPGRCPLRR